MDNSISLDISKQIYSERRIVKNHEENVQGNLEDTQLEQKDMNSTHQVYHGNMIIVSDKLNISLGPNYMFFIGGYFMVLTVSSLLVYCSFVLIKTSQNNKNLSIVHKVFAIFIAVWVNLTYLMTALSDPGRYFPGKLYITQNDNSKNCTVCKLKVPERVRHCFTCDVCMIELDHHCPWMSKCVAKNNIKSFYAFIGGMFLMMLLFWFTVFLIVSK